MANDPRSPIKKYFKPFPRWTLLLIIAGLPLLALQGVGAAPIVLGLIGIVIWTRKPSDQQIDQWVAADLSRLDAVALDRTGLDQSQLVAQRVLVWGPRFWNAGGAEVAVRKGKDGIVRFTPMGVTIINFTKDQLVAFQCALDLMTGNHLSDSTDEYFYTDVVSVSTESESKTWDKAMLTRQGRKRLKRLMSSGKLQFTAAESFTLTTSGGTSIDVVLSDAKLIKMAGGGSIPRGPAEKAIANVRRMLRDKKSR